MSAGYVLGCVCYESGTRLNAEKRLGLLYRAKGRVLVVGRRWAAGQALGRSGKMMIGNRPSWRFAVKIGVVKETKAPGTVKR